MRSSWVFLFLALSCSALAEPLEMWERHYFAVEYGDGWRGKERWRYYPRIVGSVLVTVENSFLKSEVSAALTNVGAPLHGYTFELDTADVISKRLARSGQTI
jgi:hypothetical protein